MELPGCCLWFTGLSGAGKSTIANIVVDELRVRGRKVELLDGDEVREHLSKELGFSKADRDTNIRRIGWVASVLARNGVVSVTAAISPYRELRDEVRGWVDHFVEIHVATSLEDCEARDVKGLYAKARAGDDPRVHRHLGPLRAAGVARADAGDGRATPPRSRRPRSWPGSKRTGWSERSRRSPRYRKMLTARAMTSATVTIEIADCASIVSFAQRVMGMTSVGLNAVAFVNET